MQEKHYFWKIQFYGNKYEVLNNAHCSHHKVGSYPEPSILYDTVNGFESYVQYFLFQWIPRFKWQINLRVISEKWIFRSFFLITSPRGDMYI